MSHSRRELYYHLVWTTKYRLPHITTELKDKLLSFLINKGASLNCDIISINCVCDHLHLLMYIPPNLTVSDVVHGLKGASSHEFKQFIPNFSWQAGYSVTTLRKSDLPVVQNYIDEQEKHHQMSAAMFAQD